MSRDSTRTDNESRISSLESRAALLVVVSAIFLAARLVLLYAREPFFDELFTVWMARQPMSRIIPNLLHDSGPPLYYFMARFDSVVALRWLSLLFAAVQFFIVVRRSVWAAALLALYPPAVLFSVDARAYALCGLLVTAGVLALDSPHEGPARLIRDSRFEIRAANEARVSDPPWGGGEGSALLAACFFALAAHTHYYGVLFFPLLLIRRKILPFLLAIILFGPGFFLAFHQPPQALKWNRETLLAPLANVSFAGVYPYALFIAAPLALVAIALVVLVVAVSRSSRFAPAVLVPLVAVIALHLAGKPVYFPMRFEAVIAGPLALWIGSSLGEWPQRTRRALATALLAIGAISVTLGIVDHESRPLDAYRQAVLQVRGVTGPIVATGYLYLETVVALDRPVIAWPADQGVHPGWRSTAPADPRALPQSPFVWIAERQASELRLLRGVRRLRPLFINTRALVARAESLTAPVH